MKLVKNISWSFAGNILNAFSQWFIIFLLTKSSAPDVVGEYSAALAVISPVFMFSSFSLKAQIGTDREGIFSDSTYFTTRTFTSLIASLIALVLILQKDNEHFLLIGAFLIVQKVIDSFIDLSHGFYLRANEVKKIAISLIIKSISVIICMLILASLDVLTNTYFIVIMTGSAIAFLCYDLSNGLKNKMAFSALPNAFDLIKTVFPLGLTLMLISVNSNIQKYIIESKISYEALGIYSALIYFLAVGGQFYRAMVDGVFPYLVKHFSEKNVAAFLKILGFFGGTLFLLSAVMTLGAYLFGEQILSIVYSPIYAKHNDVFVLIMIASFPIFLNSVLGSCLTAIKEFRKQTYAVTLNIIIGLSAGLVLVGQYGLKGAVYALILGHFAQFLVLSSILTTKIININD